MGFLFLGRLPPRARDERGGWMQEGSYASRELHGWNFPTGKLVAVQDRPGIRARDGREAL
jgi:hypothetical protein